MDITLAGSSVTFFPDEDDLTSISLEFAAFDGEVGIGQWPVSTSIDVLDGRRFLVREVDTVVSSGYIVDQDRDRGKVPASTARLDTFSIMDANALLDGFRVIRSRPAETDVARVLAFAALDVPLADTTWVVNSGTVTMAKKKYATDGGWGEFIQDLVDYTGKTLFLHDKAAGGLCLHYHSLTNGHTCGLTISDVPSAVNGTTVFAPGAPHRGRTSVDLRNDVKGYDQLGRTAHSIDATSKTNHNADGLEHEAYVAFDTVSQADLNVKTAAYLASFKDERDTWTCTIGPLDATAMARIRVGDLITVTSSVMGLTATAKRIAHIIARVFSGKDGKPVPGLWEYELELGAPVRRRRRGRKVITPPQVPDTGDDSPGGVSCDFDFPTFRSPTFQEVVFAGTGATLPDVPGYVLDTATELGSGQTITGAARFYRSFRTIATYDLPADTTYVRIRGVLTGTGFGTFVGSHTGPSTYSMAYRLALTEWDEVTAATAWEPTGSSIAFGTMAVNINDGDGLITQPIDLIIAASEGTFQLHLSDVSLEGCLIPAGVTPAFLVELFTQTPGVGTRDLVSGVVSLDIEDIFVGRGNYNPADGFKPFDPYFAEGTGSIVGGTEMTVTVPGTSGQDVSAMALYAFPTGPTEILCNITLPGGGQDVNLQIGYFDAAGQSMFYDADPAFGPGAVISMTGGDAVSIATSEGGATDAVGIDADDTVHLRIRLNGSALSTTIWPSTGTESGNGTTVTGAPTPLSDIIGVYVTGHADGSGSDGVFVINSMTVTVGCRSFPQAFGGISYGPVFLGLGDGSTTTFTLPTDFLDGTLAIGVDGVALETSRYSGDHDTLVVTLLTAPADGAFVTATYVPPI